MRIFFANEQLNYLKFGDYQAEDDSKLEHDIAFWSKVKEYWVKKLKESFTKEYNKIFYPSGKVEV